MIINNVDFSDALKRDHYIKKGKQAGTITDKTKQDEIPSDINMIEFDELTVIGNHILVKVMEDIPESIIQVPYLDEKFNKAVIAKLSAGFTTKKNVFISWSDERFNLSVGKKISFGSQYNKKGKILIEGQVYFIISWKDIEFVYEDE